MVASIPATPGPRAALPSGDSRYICAWTSSAHVSRIAISGRWLKSVRYSDGTTPIFQMIAERRSPGSVAEAAASSAAWAMSPMNGTASDRMRKRMASELTCAPKSAIDFVWVGTEAQEASRTMPAIGSDGVAIASPYRRP